MEPIYYAGAFLAGVIGGATHYFTRCKIWKARAEGAEQQLVELTGEVTFVLDEDGNLGDIGYNRKVHATRPYTATRYGVLRRKCPVVTFKINPFKVEGGDLMRFDK